MCERNIVFYGGAGAGKSTAAEYMVTTHGYRQVPIAETLKNVAAEIWGEGARTDRDKLQRLGVAVREIDEDAWINKFVDLTFDIGQFIVNDDCRFPNEYWKLKELGFVFVRILSNESTRVDRLLRIDKLQDHSQLEHESETALTGMEATKAGIVPDYTIFNNGSLEELHTQIENVLLDIEEST